MGSGWQDSFLCRRPLSRVRVMVGGRTASFCLSHLITGVSDFGPHCRAEGEVRALQSPGIRVCTGLEPCTNLLGNSLLTAGPGN